MKRSSVESSRSPRLERHRSWIPLTVIALGLISISMLIGTNWIREQLMIQDVALVHAVGEIQTREATSHLWIEEYVSGDEVHLSEAWENQDRSALLIDAILEGGMVGQERYKLEPLSDPVLRLQAISIRRQIEQFRDIAQRRAIGYPKGEDVGIGSAIDTEYDAVFGVMLTDLRTLASGIGDHLDRSHAQSKLLFRTILIAWVAIVSLAVWGLWTRERRRLFAESALRESEAQRLQSQKMEAVGRLAGGLAHDINNYLAAMTGHCELVKMKLDRWSMPGSETISHSMDVVMETGTKAASLIRRLLAFSRREAVQPRVVNLNRVVEGLQSMLVRLIGEDIRFDVKLEQGLWNVKVDPSQLEQVIVNLTVNASEAMPTGGRLTISSFNVDSSGGPSAADTSMDPGPFVLLAISDSGPGIPAELHDQIFEPFFTTKDKASSSGLGLATVYGIVKEAGGSIQLESEPGLGTTFKIYLPQIAEAESAAIAQLPLATLGGSQHILLVEDNDELRASTQEALELLGYKVTVARDGDEALAAFHASAAEVDLLITDVVMPGLNGREVAEKLQAQQPGLLVIFVSGHTDDVVLRHGVKENEVHFVPKPFSIHLLARKIGDVLHVEPAVIEEQGELLSRRSGS
jgi:signal transduction histidine kinase/ActR/RegA family two-component response regulator